MTVLNLEIANNQSTGYQAIADAQFTEGVTTVELTTTSASTRRHGAVWLDGVLVPSGATIDEAKGNPYVLSQDDPWHYLMFDDADDSAPVANDDIIARDKTTLSVEHK